MTFTQPRVGRTDTNLKSDVSMPTGDSNVTDIDAYGASATRPVRRSRLLGVALGVSTMAQALVELPEIARDADAVEIRLDYFTEIANPGPLIHACPMPVIVTNRPIREGGRSSASDAERLVVLARAVDAGAAYVDIEWDVATQRIVADFNRRGAQVIVSRHSFVDMPSTIDLWVDQAKSVGADVVKVVGTARDPRDVLPILGVLDRADRPTIAIAMGEAGLPSRILALRSDRCLLTFCSPSTVGGTAPGQVAISDMRSIYRTDRLGRATGVYGVLSEQVDRGFVGRLNGALAEREIGAVAVPFPVRGNLRSVVDAFRALPVAGWLAQGDRLQAELANVADWLNQSRRSSARVNALIPGDGDYVGNWLDFTAPPAAWLDQLLAGPFAPLFSPHWEVSRE